ncbi:MAG: DUF4398 domain-containing protein [Candidatus Alcyoniella australis]|nr:DUF4398 domain-containing protein [Candidatus Alcyoniella australis]
MRYAKIFTLCTLVAVLLVSGCTAGKNVTQAGKMVVQAGEAHADYLAPFEFTLAQEYLFEAQQQLDESDFSAALHFAKLSMDSSSKALSIAQQVQTLNRGEEQQ